KAVGRRRPPRRPRGRTPPLRRARPRADRRRPGYHSLPGAAEMDLRPRLAPRRARRLIFSDCSTAAGANDALKGETPWEGHAMPVDPKRVQSVFLAAAETADSVARAAVLDRECGDDAELRRRVEALLRAHDDSGSLLDQPAADLCATADAQPRPVEDTD